MKSRVLKTVVIGLVILLAFLLQNNFFAAISLIQTTPNLLLLVTVSSGLLYGRSTGLAAGFTAGLLMDIFGGTVLGEYALIFSVMGFACGYFTPYFFAEHLTLPILACIVSELIYGLYVYIFGFLIRGRFNLPFYFRTIILPETVYTVVILIIVYRLLLALSRRLERAFRRKGDEELV